MTEMNPWEPVPVGEVAEQVVGTLYHEQMLQQYWQADEQISLNALVLLCLAARRFDERVAFVLLDDSDQGEWQVPVGLASALATVAGEYESFDLDVDNEFEDHGWAASISDRTAHVWEPFLVESPSMDRWRWLSVDKVLNEITLPWRPAGEQICGQHDRPRPCLECA